MEASHILRGAMQDDDHSSNESGWTMYIGSSIHENDHCSYISEYTYNNNDTYKQEDAHCKHRCRDYFNSLNDGDDESDDSMASDASSGPNHYKFPCGNEQNLGMIPDKHVKTQSISSKKPHKHLNRRDKRRNKMEKETLALKTASAASHVQSREKSNKITNYKSHKG